MQESEIAADLGVEAGAAADTLISLSGAAAQRLMTALAANGVGNRILDEVGTCLAVWPTGTVGWVLTQNGKLRLELESAHAPGL